MTEKELGRAKEADSQGMGSAGTGAGLLRSGEPGGGAAEPWVAVLRELPREAAGPAFTQRVLARVAAVEADRRPTQARPFLLASLATAAAGALVAVLALRTVPAPPGESTAPAERRTAAERPAAAGSSGNAPAADGAARNAGSDRATDRPAGTRSLPSSSSTPAPPAAAGPGRATSRPLATSSLPRSSSVARPVHASASLAQVRAELAELRRRHRQLSAELIDLPEAAGDGRPVVYLGGDEGIELVLDLGRATVEPFAVAPASHNPTRRHPT